MEPMAHLQLVDQIVHSFVTFLVILDPPGVAVIFVSLTPGSTDELRRRTAVQATLIAGAIIVVFGLFGEWVLGTLAVTMPAFRIAGGLLLFMLATDMVFAWASGIRKPTETEEREVRHQRDIAVFPIAFPLLAGPGALTSVVLAVGSAHGLAESAGVFGALIVALALTLAALLTSSRIARLLGVTGANVIGRVLGVVLAALAAQYVVDGILQIVQGAT